VSIIASIAEFERSMISMRTKEAIRSKKDAGISVGRPEGSKNKRSKLGDKEAKIKEYLSKGMKKTEIAKLLGVSRPTLDAALVEMGVS
jgi:DNA invertase Pin-like site-specific DNA recombinase